MQWIRMRHDGVAGEITVAESALGQHLRSGWVPVTAADHAPPAAPAGPPPPADVTSSPPAVQPPGAEPSTAPPSDAAVAPETSEGE